VAACQALATEGIQRGDMSLHARSVAVAAPDELREVVARLVADHAERILEEMRAEGR
jgi:hydroxymethylglutaryl-CoA reductase